jgi:hypothetical protein
MLGVRAAPFAGLLVNGNLRHRLNARSIHFVEQIDVIQNRIQIAQHAFTLVRGEIQVGQLGHIGNVFFADLHLVVFNGAEG